MEDINIPDDTIVYAGDKLTKTWRIKNVGTCTWTPDYKLVLTNGSLVGPSSFSVFENEVPPNETVDISIPFIVPNTLGESQVFFHLDDGLGNQFGVDKDRKSPLWIQVIVEQPPLSFTPAESTPLATPPISNPSLLTDDSDLKFDFYDQYCAAEWRLDETIIPCPGIPGDANGSVYGLGQAISESGNIAPSAIIVNFPETDAETKISATYPELTVEDGDHLLVDIGCVDGAVNCSVLFNIYYVNENGEQFGILAIGEFYDRQISSHNLDLSSLAGNNVRFILEVDSLGNSSDDTIVWIQPRILRGAPILPTSTPAPKATATSTETPVPTASPLPTATPQPVVEQPKTGWEQFIESVTQFFNNLFGN